MSCFPWFADPHPETVVKVPQHDEDGYIGGFGAADHLFEILVLGEKREGRLSPVPVTTDSDEKLQSRAESR